MLLPFFKYQGTGNDFVIIDNRQAVFKNYTSLVIEKICDRKFGIGADGLMLLQNHQAYDFEMVYFNSDGKESSMCGNGGRCISAFAYSLGVIKSEGTFWAVDGEHEVKIHNKGNNFSVALKMIDVPEIEINPDYYFLNTGSPHYVKFEESIDKMNVFEEGKAIRFNNRFKKAGTNVNFVEAKNGSLFVRTYERGVEAETLSCGTGVTAAAISASVKEKNSREFYDIHTKGGDLRIYLQGNENTGFHDIWLEGPAEFVFKGEIKI